MDDFGFDFFDEDEEQTREATVEERRPEPQRGRRPPERLSPPLRLAGLIAAVVVVIVVIVVATGGSSRSSGDRRYMEKMVAPATDSQQIGQTLTTLLTQPSTATNPDLQTQLNGLIQRQQQDVTQAQAIKAPPRLRGEHQSAVEALQFRLSGLRGLLDVLSRQTASSTSASTLAPLVAAQNERLLTSDVVWIELFQKPARDQLQADRADGVTVPSSRFLSNTDLASPTALTGILQQLGGAATGGGSTSTTAVLKQGDKGTTVAAWQAELNKWLKVARPTQPQLATDGAFGPGTVTATKDFQQAVGLTADGVVGAKTRAALAKALKQAGVS